MASPDTAPGRPTGAALFALALVVLATAFACRFFSTGARPCWGDIVPVADGAAPEPRSLQLIATTGTPRPGGVVDLGPYELHYIPIHHGSHDDMEIGWANLRIVDPRACRRDTIWLSLGDREGTSVAPVQLFHDVPRDVYLVRAGAAFVGRFARHAAPGLVRPWAAFLAAVVFDGAAAVAWLLGRRRARRGGGLIFTSMMLAACGTLLVLLR